ncbi:hypothetical protein LSCM4_05687 [Leishmania orientalis]|uniref:Uncharacterized protein n=1 Tax=Leishmania orientalis TaxID=2249476 RepID=A0A836HTR0_9TRYP|nr:hypothetical protein LSCM4_05687 [Leishmania orientalis]
MFTASCAMSPFVSSSRNARTRTYTFTRLLCFIASARRMPTAVALRLKAPLLPVPEALRSKAEVAGGRGDSGAAERADGGPDIRGGRGGVGLPIEEGATPAGAGGVGTARAELFLSGVVERLGVTTPTGWPRRPDASGPRDEFDRLNSISTVR